MFKIVSDSSCDIFSLEGAEFKSVPLKIIAGEKEFSDVCGENVAEMVTYLKDFKGKSGSSCPATADWMEAFEGADEIFAVTITSGLSGSYNSACVAKEMFISNHPEAKIEVIDSLSAGPELTLIINKLEKLKKEGLNFTEINEKIREYQKNTGLVFMLESLKNLANNGRVSHAVSAITSILGIRLIGKASDEGTLEPLHKSRGEKKALSTLYSTMLDNGYKGGKVVISHCLNEDAAAKLKEKIQGMFLNAKVIIQETKILCSFYAEQGGLLVGFEK